MESMIDSIKANINKEVVKKNPNWRRIRAMEKRLKEFTDQYSYPTYLMDTKGKGKPKVKLPNWMNRKKMEKLGGW